MLVRNLGFALTAMLVWRRPRREQIFFTLVYAHKFRGFRSSGGPRGVHLDVDDRVSSRAISVPISTSAKEQASFTDLGLREWRGPTVIATASGFDSAQLLNARRRVAGIVPYRTASVGRDFAGSAVMLLGADAWRLATQRCPDRGRTG